MGRLFLSFNSVEFSYPSSIQPVLMNVNFDLAPGWTGITGENGAGKTTLLMLAVGLLRPCAGTVRGPDHASYCPQRTDQVSWDWEDIFFAADNDTGRLLDRLGIEVDWPYRWETLSHGERKRFQLAAALRQNPDLLAVDEPTNHLDAEAAALVRDALSDYRGIGLLVSHDIDLLDKLCGNCLFLREGTVTLRPGGVSQGLTEEERERVEQRNLRKKLNGEEKRLAAEAARRLRVVEGSRQRLSKRRVAPADRDTRGKINLARLSGKDRVGADSYKRMRNRVNEVREAREEAANPHERKLGITLSGQRARGDRLLFLESGSILLGEGRSLSFPELMIRPGDRIALSGPNGTGKSSLVRYILPRIHVPLLYIPQEIETVESCGILEAVLREDERVRGDILSRFSRLGANPSILFNSARPSPGEVRKLMIARGIFCEPAIIVMDEPTNHLDMVSIGLLEAALAEYAGALLLVSHDERFLSALTGQGWAVTRHGPASTLTIVT